MPRALRCLIALCCLALPLSAAHSQTTGFIHLKTHVTGFPGEVDFGFSRIFEQGAGGLVEKFRAPGDLLFQSSRSLGRFASLGMRCHCRFCPPVPLPPCRRKSKFLFDLTPRLTASCALLGIVSP